MSDYLVIFVAGFVSVYALGFQSLNVRNGYTGSAMLTSGLIAVSQGMFYKTLPAMDDWLSLAVYALSGSLGIGAAMKTHDPVHAWISRLRNRRADRA